MDFLLQAQRPSDAAVATETAAATVVIAVAVDAVVDVAAVDVAATPVELLARTAHLCLID
jgi:hypothetical protein